MPVVSVGQLTITDVNDGLSLVLSNNAHTVPTNSSGGSPVLTGAVSTAKVLAGGVDISSQFVITAVGSVGVSGSYANNTYTVTGFTVDVGTVDFTATRAGSDPLTARFTITKAKQGSAGSPGLNGITIVMSNEAHTFPASSAGVVSSYANSGTTVQVYEGSTLLNAVSGATSNGSFSVGAATQSPASSITVGAISHSSKTATISVHSAMSNGTDAVSLTFPITIKRANGTTSTVNKVQVLTKSKQGATGGTGATGKRGSVHLFKDIAGSAWLDSETNSLFASAPYNPKQPADRVTLKNAAAKFSETRAWTGTAWAIQTEVLDGSLLVTDSVTANAINTTSLYSINAEISGSLRVGNNDNYVQLGGDTFIRAQSGSEVLFSVPKSGRGLLQGGSLVPASVLGEALSADAIDKIRIELGGMVNEFGGSRSTSVYLQNGTYNLPTLKSANTAVSIAFYHLGASTISTNTANPSVTVIIRRGPTTVHSQTFTGGSYPSYINQGTQMYTNTLPQINLTTNDATPGTGDIIYSVQVTVNNYPGFNAGNFTFSISQQATGGTQPVAQIPDLPASKITSGTFAVARIPTGISITGNAATATTATRLATTRQLTIGSSGKNFDGQASVSWSLAEIGAAASSHNHNDLYFTEAESDSRYIETNAYKDFTVGGDANTYYPVLLSGGKYPAWGSYSIARGYAWTAPSTWNNSTHKGGLTLNFRWSGDSGWGGNDKTVTVEQFNETYSTMVGGMVLTTSGLIVFLRGGGALYRYYSPSGVNATATVYLSGFTASNNTVYSNRLNNSGNSEIFDKFPVRGTTVYSQGSLTLTENNYNTYTPTKTGAGASGTWGISVTGNAGSATMLATTRSFTLSGVTATAQNFNGTGNVTIPITAVPATLLTGTIADARISGSYTGMTNLTGSGTVDFAKFLGNAGDTVSAPSFSWTGDTNTGIYRPASDQLAITTGGVQRALFNSSGVTATTFIGALSGNATSATTATTTTGNAGSATRLQFDRTINRTLFNGTTNVEVTEWFHSNRDFVNGTLVTTAIDYSGTNGDPWVLEVRGNSYSGEASFDLQAHGYIYSNTIINIGGIISGYNMSGIVALNLGGKLCFWWPRYQYWQGFNVRVYRALATHGINLVQSITNATDPIGTKRITISDKLKVSLRSDNFNSYTPTLTGTGASGSWGISVTGNAGTVTNGVYTTGNQTIGGVKTFSSTISGSVTGNAGTVTNGVYTTGNQTIGGVKTFSSTISGSVTGNAGTVTNGVYTTGNQTIGGVKTFSSGPVFNVRPVIKDVLEINSGSPTINLRDSDGLSAFVHVNSNYFYILRGLTNATTWTQTGAGWPLQIDLNNNLARFGGELTLNNTIPRGSLGVSTNIATAVDCSIHLGYAPADFYGFRILNSSQASSFAAGTFKIQRGTTSSWVDALTVSNTGEVKVTNASYNSMQTSGGIFTTLGLRRDNTGSSWISQKDSTSVGLYNDTAVSTSSYAAVLRQRHASHTYTIGGLGNNYFGIFSYFNSRTDNGTDGFFRMDVAGNCVASGNSTALDHISTSDRRTKSDLVQIKDALTKVNKMSGYTFLRKDCKVREAGYIAQDLEAVLPEGVKEVENIKRVSNSATIALVIEAVKELSAEVNRLKAVGNGTH